MSRDPQHTRSRDLFARSSRRLPGGVNSPVRAFAAVGGEPFFVERGQGARLYDVDGNRYLDYIGSWGPLILGHAHPAVVAAVGETLQRGTTFGAATEGELLLAEEIHDAFPAVSKMRLVSSGTEATMSAIRLARGVSGREGIIKCNGCYHGHVDALLVAAGSGAATLGIPDSKGVPASVVGKTHVIPFNDSLALDRLLRERSSEIACFILEPVAGNMGCVPPEPGYLETVREVCSRYGVLLIMDEVMSGFRVARGGAQERYGVTADLTTLGKIVGGGLPVGAYGGSSELMSAVAPEGGVYQAGTLSGNPLAVSAGLTTLRLLKGQGLSGEDDSWGGASDPYTRLEDLAGRLSQGLVEAAAAAGVPVQVNRVGSMLTVFFTGEPVRDFAGAKASDSGRFARFFHGMLEAGVAWPPSQFEAAFVSLAHDESDIDATVTAAANVLKGLAGTSVP